MKEKITHTIMYTLLGCASISSACASVKLIKSFKKFNDTITMIPFKFVRKDISYLKDLNSFRQF